MLFTSAAEGGKIDTVDSSLSTVSDYSGNEWKVTLLDSKRNFTAQISSADSAAKTYTVSYQNATVGDNEYISAFIKDSNGNITNYGRLAKPESTSGTFTFETDRFSLYAIAYKDADQSVDSIETVNTASVSSTAASPKTGETTNMTSCLVIFTVVLVGIYVGTCVKRRKENR